MKENSLVTESITEKLFYADSHLLEFTAQVTACSAVVCRQEGTSAGDGGEKETEAAAWAGTAQAGMADSALGSLLAADKFPAGAYAVELDRTAFFPEGGGQYADTGFLDQIRVTDVQEKDGHIYHLTDTAILPGTLVTGRIDKEERLMKMQQHTGEHIVSGIIHRKHGYNNVGFHLGSADCTMDFDGELTAEDLAAAEQEANRAVWENLKIRTLYPSREEAEALDYRSKIEIEGQVRVIEVPGYDLCACCAPHVKRTGEIGPIKLTNVQRYKGGARVTMLAGVRALADYAEKQVQAKHISALLCAKENEIADAVEHVLSEVHALKEELTKKENAYALSLADAVPEELPAVCLFSAELSADAMRLAVNRVLEKEHRLCAGFCGDDEKGYRYIIGSKTENLREFVKTFNAALNGRGGGRSEMVQGTVYASHTEIEDWIRQYAGL